MAVFSLEALEARRLWNDMLKVLKEEKPAYELFCI